jgi:anti-sigma B factor antagonist
MYSRGGKLTCLCPSTTISAIGPGLSHKALRPEQHFDEAVSLRITNREVDQVVILDITGRIVLGDELEMLREAVRALITQGKKKIILNLADVSYIDSSGVGELVRSFTSVRNQGGELKLLNLTQKVHDVLHVTKLYTVFDIREDEFKAIKSFDYFFAK